MTKDRIFVGSLSLYCSLTISFSFYDLLISKFLKVYQYKLLCIFWFVCFNSLGWELRGSYNLKTHFSFYFNKFPYVFLLDNFPIPFFYGFSEAVINLCFTGLLSIFSSICSGFSVVYITDIYSGRYFSMFYLLALLLMYILNHPLISKVLCFF